MMIKVRYSRVLSAALLGAGLVTTAPMAADKPSAPGRKLGFVVTHWDNALYETTYMEECPDGLAMGSADSTCTAVDV